MSESLSELMVCVEILVLTKLIIYNILFNLDNVGMVN